MNDTTGTLAAFYGLNITDTQLANRIISAVYRKDGRKALEQIEIEVEARLTTVLWQLAFDFECDGNTRMANRCQRANNHLTGSN